MATRNPTKMAELLLGTLHRDLPALQRNDDYWRGRHDGPYMPASADAEYRLLASRAVSNWMPLLVSTPSQAMYVDDYRVDTSTPDSERGEKSPLWLTWEGSGLQARQSAVHEGAFAHGHSFTMAYRDGDRVRSKGLSALRTAAVYDDPANDIAPVAAASVTRWNHGDEPGLALMWDDQYEYEVVFRTLTDKIRVVGRPRRHGNSECPVTRFAPSVDLDGRTVGVIGPMIPLQNRINQSVFDLLVAQTYGSFQVRTVSGMAPPMQRDPNTGDLLLDDNGNPRPVPMDHNARRFLFAEDPDTKFGTLPGSPLNGYIESIDMSIRHLAAVSQTPPHHLLGQIANLSAEALLAAETSLARMVADFRANFGVSWERDFQLRAELLGETGALDNFGAEIIWRDMEQRSLAQAADALGKLKEQLGIPAKGLWKRVPGVTAGELDDWQREAEEGDAQQALASAIDRGLGRTQPARSAPPEAA